MVIAHHVVMLLVVVVRSLVVAVSVSVTTMAVSVASVSVVVVSVSVSLFVLEGDWGSIVLGVFGLPVVTNLRESHIFIQTF